MGIKDFYKAVELLCGGNVIETHHISDFAGYKVAIDISVFLYKTIRSAGPVRWIDSFLIFLCLLKRNNIIPVAIFDGPNPPPEKKAEQERRRAENEKVIAKLKVARKIYQKIKDEIAKGNDDLDEDLQIQARGILESKGRKKISTVIYSDARDVAAAMKEAIEKYEVQTLPITDDYKKKAKEALEIMGIAQFQADGEAEALCSALCVKGLVDAVMSEDTDTLAYGTPLLLAKIDLKKHEVVAVQLCDILKHSGLNYEEFRDFTILLQNDYNRRVKGYPPDGKKRKKPVGIGMKATVAMIQEYRRLEECEKYIVDPDPLIYRRCRELFTVPAFLDIDIIPYSRAIKQDRLAEFLKRTKARPSVKYIMEAWKPSVKLVFGDQQDQEEVDELDEIELGDEDTIDDNEVAEDVEETNDVEEEKESLEDRLDRMWNTDEWVFVEETTPADDLTLDAIDCVSALCGYQSGQYELAEYAGKYTLAGTEVSLCHVCFDNGSYGGEEVEKAIRETY